MTFASPRDRATSKQSALLSNLSDLTPTEVVIDKNLMWSSDMAVMSWSDSPLAVQKLMLSLQLLLLSASQLARHPQVLCGREGFRKGTTKKG